MVIPKYVKLNVDVRNEEAACLAQGQTVSLLFFEWLILLCPTKPEPTRYPNRKLSDWKLSYFQNYS